MTLQVASTSSECCITVVSSMTDKAVSTEDLPSYTPSPEMQLPQRTTMSSVVANELLRLEAALHAVMQATSPTEEELPVVVRRPRSHSHHHCFHDMTAAVHPRRSRRSASAIVLQNPHSPYMCSHHVPRDLHGCLGASPGPSTISSDGYSRGRINSDHLCLPVTELELQGPLVAGSGKRRRKKRKKRKNSKTGGANTVIVDPDELPKRARWTIVATACLLLFMCFLLVGITLRMAPIIDEMVRKENEQLMNSLNRAGVTDETGSALNLSSPGVISSAETSSATDPSSSSSSSPSVVTAVSETPPHNNVTDATSSTVVTTPPP